MEWLIDLLLIINLIKLTVMAILQNNHLLAGLSGKIGNFVLKQVKGKTIMCSVPTVKKGKLSKQQRANQQRFKQAVAYAKAINDDPAKREAYLKKVKKGESVYQYAMREYFKMNK